MFIDFPDYDFKFVITNEVDKEQLATWLTDANISTYCLEITEFLNLYCLNGRVFSIKDKRIYLSGVYLPVNDLPLVDIIKPIDAVEKDRQLLLNILDSILKEIKYYRKGKKDPVLKLFRYEILKLDKNFLYNPNYLLSLFNFSYVVTTEQLQQKATINHLNFYRSIWYLAIKTYFNFKNLHIPVSIPLLNDIAIKDYVRIAGYNVTLYANNFSWVHVKQFPPKYTIKKINNQLKPTVVSDTTELPYKIFHKLTTLGIDDV